MSEAQEQSVATTVSEPAATPAAVPTVTHKAQGHNQWNPDREKYGHVFSKQNAGMLRIFQRQLCLGFQACMEA